MCKACGCLCCSAEVEKGCGCEYCFDPDCWPLAAKVGPGLEDEDALVMPDTPFEDRDGAIELDFNDA